MLYVISYGADKKTQDRMSVWKRTLCKDMTVEDQSEDRGQDGLKIKKKKERNAKISYAL